MTTLALKEKEKSTSHLFLQHLTKEGEVSTEWEHTALLESQEETGSLKQQQNRGNSVSLQHQ